ncbi:MAG: tetratricopeptide repeat protein [Candidatus Eisenbacteria bacterium]
MRNLENVQTTSNATIAQGTESWKSTRESASSAADTTLPGDDAATAHSTWTADEFWTEDLLTEEDTCTEAEILEAFQGFLEGDLTLAQLEGMSAEDLYQVADMGYDLMTEGKLEDAKKIFEGLYVYNPFDAYFHTALGSIYQRQGDLEAAYEHYLSAVELYDEDVQTWTNLGEVALEQSTKYMKAGRTAEAEAAFVNAAEALGRAIALDPEAKEDAGRRAHALVHVTVGAMQSAMVH